MPAAAACSVSSCNRPDHALRSCSRRTIPTRMGSTATAVSWSQALAVCAVEPAAAARPGGEQSGNHPSRLIEHPRLGIDPQAAEREGDGRNDLDHVIRRIDQRRRVELAARVVVAGLALLVELEQRVAGGRSGITPLVGQRLELLDLIRDGGSGATAIRELELVEGFDALYVGRHHPLVVDAL